MQLPRATHLLALFERQDDAERFYRVLPRRLGKFGLTLAAEKTRVLPFGRAHWRAGQPWRESFDVLGFRHPRSHDRQGRMAVVRLPSPKSRRKFLQETQQGLRGHPQAPPRIQREVLTAQRRGFSQYFALQLTTVSLKRVRHQVQRQWYQTLRRRSQRGLPWEVLQRRPWFRLPAPRILHPTV